MKSRLIRLKLGKKIVRCSSNRGVIAVTICLFSQPCSFNFRILSSRTVHDRLKNQELNSSDSGIDHRGQANKELACKSSSAPPC